MNQTTETVSIIAEIPKDLHALLNQYLDSIQEDSVGCLSKSDRVIAAAIMEYLMRGTNQN